MSVSLSEHAVERYQERVKPALSREQAMADVVRVLALADRRGAAPAWVTSERDAHEWRVLADDIAFPVRDGVVVTCLTRSQPGDVLREERSEGGPRHRRRRKNAPGYRTEHGKVAREARRRRRELQERVDG